MSKKLVQLFEHEELRIGEQGIEEKHLKLLSQLHLQTRGLYFDLIHRGVKFKQYVGVLKVGDLVIEILPKGDRAAKKSISPQDKLPWRTLFVQLLSRIGYIDTELGPRAPLFLQRGSLIDLYVRHFLVSVRALCREGLVRTYIPRSKTRQALKGQIQFNRQIIRDLRGTVGFETKAFEYERGHILNRVLLTALHRTQDTRLSHIAYDMLPELFGYFDGVEPLHDPIEILRALQFDRRTERYRSVIDLAKPILLSAHPGVRAGIDDTFSMFFDMNRVWESYIFCELKRAAAPTAIRVDKQVVASFWQSRTVRPDIVVYFPHGKRVVIDTKWKELTTADPSSTDLLQMFTYNHQIGAHQSILLFPDIHGLEGKGGPFETGESAQHGCWVDFARIWRRKDDALTLNAEIGREVMGIVERVVG